MDKYFLDRKDALLLIVDVQERLAAAMTQREKVVANCIHLVEGADLLGLPVILTEQYPNGLGPTVRVLREKITHYEPVEKITFDCCRETSFSRRLTETGRKKVILAGMETHVCVLQTALGLMRDGYSVHVVEDAVCSRAKENFRVGLEFMRDAGSVISCTETVLFQLLERAGTAEFKAVSSMIK
ncbi:MAG: hydrolase [Candidatus Sulfobium sp.]|jgi:nicotinamidase-related amidase